MQQETHVDSSQLSGMEKSSMACDHPAYPIGWIFIGRRRMFVKGGPFDPKQFPSTYLARTQEKEQA
jgi:hypothetical protein